LDPQALAGVKGLVEQMQRMRPSLQPNDNLELEARVQNTGGGLTQQQLEQLLARLSNADPSVFESSSTWNESRDVFYRIPSIPHLVRGEVHIDPLRMTATPKTVYKTRLRKVDLVTPKYNVRVTLSKETVLPDHVVPDVVVPEFIRVKHRKSFVRSSSDQSARFSYDVTQAWSGTCMSDVEHNQNSPGVTPTYEFEIEHLYSHPDIRPDWVAASLLLKIQDHLEGDFLTAHSSSQGTRRPLHRGDSVGSAVGSSVPSGMHMCTRARSRT
jgi:hypothetical protein